MGPCTDDAAAACSDSVRLSNFSISGFGEPPKGQAPQTVDVPAPGCPGKIQVAGHGEMDIVPTGWQTATGGAPLDVIDGKLVPHMGARGYFAEGCSAGSYKREQYAALNLLGKRMQFTTD